MEPLQALSILAQATGDPSLKLNRQDTHMVEEALRVLQNLLVPSPPPTEGTAADGPGGNG